MIKRTKIKDENGTGEYSFFTSPDIEYVDPIEYYSSNFIQVNFLMMRDLILLNKVPFPIDVMEKVIYKQAVKDWIEKYNDILSTPVPENFLNLFSSKSKTEQVKLLKNSSITPEQMISLLFIAKKDFGYSFSQYTAEYAQKGLDRRKMPKVVEIKKGVVHKVGPTTLSDAQLKQAIDHRKITVAKFLDKKKEWHCLFLNFDSIKGKESWKGGQPHYHYISDKFGLSRDMVLHQLKSERYNLNSLPHIDLIGYRNKDD